MHPAIGKVRHNAFIQKWIMPPVRRIRQDWETYRLKSLCVSKQEFIRDVKTAIDRKVGYAAGKIGGSQKHWMYYEILLASRPSEERLESYHQQLCFHGLKQCGVFPADPEFYLRYNRFYMEHVRALDCLGIFFEPRELELIKHYDLASRLVDYIDLEPDRSSPANDVNCYLPYFRNKRVLLICPFAGLLKERATKEVFEGVWSKTGKRWFYPASVEALEFPYGFSPETQKEFPTAIELFYSIRAGINSMDFDVALIGASGLAIPVASHVKSMGKIAIDLGGHLQVLFGVIGKRWRSREGWKRDYFNDWWIDMPAVYRPRQTDVCDQGAYW
jgi:hypothetical protein